MRNLCLRRHNDTSAVIHLIARSLYNRISLQGRRVIKTEPLYTAAKHKFLLILILSVFTLSGSTALIYESIWTRYLALFLGHSAYAQSLVLVIFMGGLTLGSLIAAPLVEKLSNPVRAYGLLEIVIGVSALFFPFLYQKANIVLSSYYTSSTLSFFSPSLIKHTMAGLLIFIPCTLLGMTFPMLSSGLVRAWPQNPGRIIAFSYFSNSVGAALGVIISGFILVYFFGYSGSLLYAGSLNILLGVASIIISYAPLYRDTPASREKTPSLHRVKPTTLLLVCALLTGFASFMYEIGWIRMLTFVLGSSTHAFELMLSAFILGIGLGSYWINSKLDKSKTPIILLCYIQALMAMFAICSFFLYYQLFGLMSFMVSQLPHNTVGYFLFNAFSHVICMILMLPTAFCAGMTLPVITCILIKKTRSERSIGVTYGVNTVGCILGVLTAVHIVMPVLGVKYVVLIGALIDALIALALLRHASAGLPVNFNKVTRDKIHIQRLLCVVFGGIVVVGMFYGVNPKVTSSQVFRTGAVFIGKNHTTEFHQDGKTATVSVHRSKTGQVSLTTNGKVDASANVTGLSKSTDEVTQALLAIFPVTLMDHLNTAAVIGFGSGITSHIMLSDPDISSLDTIEIEPAIVDAAKHFYPLNKNAYHDRRHRIILDDCRSYFSFSNKKYDTIISEPSNPWVSGVSNLFTKQFYRITAEHLSRNGIFFQWIHLYEINDNLLASIMKALQSSFKHYIIYATDNTNIIVAAYNHRTPILHKAKFKLFKNRYIEHLDIKSIDDLRIRQIITSRLLTPYINQFAVKANSDFHPVLDLYAVKSRFLNQSSQLSQIGAHIPLALLSSSHDKNLSHITNAGSINKIKLYLATKKIIKDVTDHKRRPSTSIIKLLKNSNEGVYGTRQLQQISQQLPTLLTMFMQYANKRNQSILYSFINQQFKLHKASQLAYEWLKLYKQAINSHFQQVRESVIKINRDYSSSLSALNRAYLIGMLQIAEIKLGHYQSQASPCQQLHCDLVTSIQPQSMTIQILHSYLNYQRKLSN